MSNKKFSRLAFVEEKKDIRKAYFFIILSIATIIFLFFFGLPMIVKFAGFVGDLGKSDKPVEIADTTPPAPPQFNDIPDFTNKEVVDISGKSESGATIKINANDSTSEVVANSDGVFNYKFNLKDGQNTLNAVAVDTAGNVSVKSQEFTIVFDNKEPVLEITSPNDKVSFYGSSQRQLSIKGNVNEISDIYINGRFVTLKDDKTFVYLTTLSEGENKFDITATDPAGNQTSKSITVNFSL